MDAVELLRELMRAIDQVGWSAPLTVRWRDSQDRPKGLEVYAVHGINLPSEGNCVELVMDCALPHETGEAEVGLTNEVTP